MNTNPPTSTLLTDAISDVPTARVNHRSVAAFGKTWQQHINTDTVFPTPREDFSFCEHAGNLIVFGGRGVDSDGGISPLHDLWMYSIDKNEWTEVHPIGTDAPFGVKGSSLDSAPMPHRVWWTAC
ncbi:hypothetical protein BLNAU_23528 [Blattamonas nauphoetae]|uniref:Uncharacterized protein n=1 Tax=Blattamonas nauphoetae TaxID=2049346 RepID=A0ABQ9WQ04_9EUKA|nr:hypothetical protein BLNAU_23528 [Blattamonas nauphoetae]